MYMDMAAKTLNIQQDLKVAELAELIFGDYEGTNKCWGTYPTTPYTITLTDGQIKIINDRAVLYTVKRDDRREF